MLNKPAIGDAPPAELPFSHRLKSKKTQAQADSALGYPDNASRTERLLLLLLRHLDVSPDQLQEAWKDRH